MQYSFSLFISSFVHSIKDVFRAYCVSYAMLTIACRNTGPVFEEENLVQRLRQKRG
jgi:hypothetical protein